MNESRLNSLSYILLGTQTWQHRMPSNTHLAPLKSRFLNSFKLYYYCMLSCLVSFVYLAWARIIEGISMEESNRAGWPVALSV